MTGPRRQCYLNFSYDSQAAKANAHIAGEKSDSVIVTIVTCVSTEDTDGQSLQKLKISSILFDQSKVSSITEVLNDDKTFPGTGLILILVEEWPLWFDQPFRQCFSDLDLDVSTVMYATTVQGSSTIPSFDDEHAGVKFVLETISRQESQSMNFLESPKHLEAAYIGGDFIACWTRGSHGLLNRPDRPVAIVAGPKSYYLGLRLEKYYSEHERRRWTRLETCPWWIYVDVFSAFTGWGSVLAALSLDLQQSEIDGYQRNLSILDRTRTLHRSIAIIIRMSELLRIHQSSITRIQTKLKRSGQSGLTDLESRLDSIFLMLDYYAQTCQTMKEQTGNLLNLEFNTETVSQALAVRRLNGLALVFVPLTFTASIFGMIHFTGGWKWYPIIACPLTICTVLTAFFAQKIKNKMDDWGRANQQARNAKRRASKIPSFSHGRGFDLENQALGQTLDGDAQAITPKISAIWAIRSDTACDTRHVYALDGEMNRNHRGT